MLTVGNAAVTEPELSVQEIQEGLLARRFRLHEQLGEISQRLNDAQQAYHDCIAEIINVNEEIRRQNLDTSGLEAALANVALDSDELVV